MRNTNEYGCGKLFGKLVVIILIGIVVLLAAGYIIRIGVKRNANTRACQANLEQIYWALHSFVIEDTNNILPAIKRPAQLPSGCLKDQDMIYCPCAGTQLPYIINIDLNYTDIFYRGRGHSRSQYPTTNIITNITVVCPLAISDPFRFGDHSISARNERVKADNPLLNAE